MRKATRHYLIDVTLIVLTLILWISSFLLWVVFPRGYFAAREIWVTVHKWSGLALSIMVVIHLVVHWKWLWQMTRRYLRRQSDVKRQPRE